MESTHTQPIWSSSHHHERTLATPLDDLGSSFFPPLYPRRSHNRGKILFSTTPSSQLGDRRGRGPAASASAIRKYIPSLPRGPSFRLRAELRLA